MTTEAIESLVRVTLTVVIILVFMFIIWEHVVFKTITYDVKVCRFCGQPYKLVYRKKQKVDVWQMRSDLRDASCHCHKLAG